MSRQSGTLARHAATRLSAPVAAIDWLSSTELLVANGAGLTVLEARAPGPTGPPTAPRAAASYCNGPASAGLAVKRLKRLPQERGGELRERARVSELHTDAIRDMKLNSFTRGLSVSVGYDGQCFVTDVERVVSDRLAAREHSEAGLYAAGNALSAVAWNPTFASQAPNPLPTLSPPSRTNRTRLVPPPVLIGHVSQAPNPPPPPLPSQPPPPPYCCPYPPPYRTHPPRPPTLSPPSPLPRPRTASPSHPPASPPGRGGSRLRVRPARPNGRDQRAGPTDETNGQDQRTRPAGRTNGRDQRCASHLSVALKWEAVDNGSEVHGADGR